MNDELLRMALVGYRQQVQEIEQKMEAIRADLARPERQYRTPVQLKRGGGYAVKPIRKGISAAGRARIAAAQRARWAKIRSKKAAA